MQQGIFSGTFVAPGPPYFDEQTWGGVLAMFIGVVWFSKASLKDVWSRFFGAPSPKTGAYRIGGPSWG